MSNLSKIRTFTGFYDNKHIPIYDGSVLFVNPSWTPPRTMEERKGIVSFHQKENRYVVTGNINNVNDKFVYALEGLIDAQVLIYVENHE